MAQVFVGTKFWNCYVQEHIPAVTMRKTMSLIQLTTAHAYEMCNQVIQLLENIHISQLLGLFYRGNKICFQCTSRTEDNVSTSLAIKAKSFWFGLGWSYIFFFAFLRHKQDINPKSEAQKISHKRIHLVFKTVFLNCFPWNSVNLEAFLKTKELSRGFVTPREIPCCPGCCCVVL